MRLETETTPAAGQRGCVLGQHWAINGIGGSKSFRSQSSSPYWQPTGASCPRGHAVCRVPARHPEAKHRKAGLKLNNRQAASFPEDVLVGGIFSRQAQRTSGSSLGALIAQAHGQVLESPCLVSEFLALSDRSQSFYELHEKRCGMGMSASYPFWDHPEPLPLAPD